MELRLAAKIDLNRSPETDDERFTVRQLKGALNQLGWYMPDPKEGMNDEIDDNLRDAVYAYQRKSTIFYDDVDLGPGSTTERLLNEDLDYRERDYLFSGAYIWRTVGDEKVRGSHAARNSQRFLWSQPPEGGHPSEDYNCRCWAESVNPPYHPWMEWVKERRKLRAKLAPPEGLKVKSPDFMMFPADAINPTISPLDFIGLSGPLAKVARREVIIPAARAGVTAAVKLSAGLAAKVRDVEWIRNAPVSKIQHMYKVADKFGVKGNWNPKNGEEFRAALEAHIKSADTKVIKGGSYHTKPATHYLNPKTNLNVIKNEAGEVEAAWKVSQGQKFHLLKNGKLGGGKK